MQCPACQRMQTIKNGSIPSGKPKWQCTACGRQCVANPGRSRIPPETIVLVDRLLLETVSLAGIAHATGVSPRWLQYYVNKKYATVPRTVAVHPKKKGRLTVECDERWSFVQKKTHHQWLWLALDRDTREIVGVAIGQRDQATAQELWESLPPLYRQCAVVYTDFWAAYGAALPAKRHRPGGKETGGTAHLERFNTTLRQRLSRLVRKTLSFSKKVENHIGAIWLFIHHYNATRPRPATIIA